MDVSPIAGSRIIRNATVQEVYEVEDTVLGVGATGQVRLVTHRASGRRCALKSLSTIGLSDRRLGMLHDEVEIFLSLDHPNICRLFEVYQDDTAVHLVMELCEGEAMSRRLQLRRVYSEREAAVVCIQMLEALSYLHWQKICHRDLKLDNWVYADASEDAKLKLIDFGLSMFFRSLPEARMEGTAVYMAPEIWEGTVDEKCDIWALGVIMYMLLSGPLPSAGENTSEVARRIMMEGFSFDGPHWDGVSPRAKAFVGSLLEDDPEDRPSARECMCHEWLAGLRVSPCAEGNRGSVSDDVLHRMRAFASQNALTRAVCGLMAFSMSARDALEVEQQFRSIDVESTGVISLDELTAVFKRRLRMSEEEVRRVFLKLDQTGDRMIHYSEFVAAAVSSRDILHKAAIREAFHKFDAERKGFISVDDLRRVLGDEYAGTQVEDIVTAVDSSKNGVIDYAEFVEALREQPFEGAAAAAAAREDAQAQAVIRRLSRRTLGRISRRASGRGGVWIKQEPFAAEEQPEAGGV